MSRPLWPYPFPLDDGTIATLHLPPDLTPSEAKRLTAYVYALAIAAPTETEP